MGLLQKIFKFKTDVDEESFHSLNLEEKDMIRGIVELSDTNVKEVMVPRIDVVFVSVDTGTEDLLQILTDCGHSRVPVYEETIDNVIGVPLCQRPSELYVQAGRDKYTFPYSKSLFCAGK